MIYNIGIRIDSYIEIKMKYLDESNSMVICKSRLEESNKREGMR